MAIAGLLCVSLTPFEPLIADVHDQAPASSAVCGTHDECTQHTPPSNGGGRDTHPFHVDHCAHSHLAAVPATNAGDRDLLAAPKSVIGEPSGLHESIVLPPQQRPPIA